MTTQATADLLAEVQALIHERERDGVLGLAELIGPAEWADLVPQLEPSEVAVLIQWLPGRGDRRDPRGAAADRGRPDPPHPVRARGRASCSARWTPTTPRTSSRRCPDDAVAEILVRMKPEDAAEIRQLSGYDPDTAGGIMTPEFVAVSKDATSAQAIAAIRRLVDEAETVNYVYVVDDERHLLGVLSLYRLLLSPERTPVEQLMAPSTVRVKASADQETAARILTDRNLLAIPVVDDDDHLSGSSPRTTSPTSSRPRRPRTSSASAAASRSTCRTAWRPSRCSFGSASAGCCSCSSPRATRARSSRASRASSPRSSR